MDSPQGTVNRAVAGHSVAARSVDQPACVVPSKNSFVLICLRFSGRSGYLAGLGQMAWDSHGDTAVGRSHAQRCHAWAGSIRNTSGKRREPIQRINGRHR